MSPEQRFPEGGAGVYFLSWWLRLSLGNLRAGTALSPRTCPTDVPAVSVSLHSRSQDCSPTRYCFLTAPSHSAALWHMLTCPARDWSTRRSQGGQWQRHRGCPSFDLWGRCLHVSFCGRWSRTEWPSLLSFQANNSLAAFSQKNQPCLQCLLTFNVYLFSETAVSEKHTKNPN